MCNKFFNPLLALLSLCYFKYKNIAFCDYFIWQKKDFIEILNSTHFSFFGIRRGINLFSSVLRLSLLVSFLFLMNPELYGDEKIPSAREILDMDTDRAFLIIGKLNKPQTEELITQIRVLARAEYKEIDKFYLLISHLETMKAIEEEDKKLKDLNLVYGLALLLFLGVIGYNIISEKKAIRTIEDQIRE